MRNLSWIVCVLALVALVAGCSNGKLIAQKDQQIADMQNQIDALEGEVEEERERSAALNADLEAALNDLEQKEQIWLEEREGLTHITLDGEVTFSSGSSRLTSSGKEILDKEVAFNRAAGLTPADDRIPEFMKYEKLPPHDVVWDVPDETLDAVFA